MENHDNGIQVADSCHYRPEPDLILAEIFSGKRFVVFGHEITAQEMFAMDGGFPLLVKDVASGLNETGVGSLDHITVSEDDSCLFGYSVKTRYANTSDVLVFLLQSIIVAKSKFNVDSPSAVDLDRVFGSIQ